MIGFFLIVCACALWALDTLIRYPLIQGGVDALAIVFYEHLALSLIFGVIYFKSIPKVWNARISHLTYFFIVGGIGSALATYAFTRAFIYLNPSLVILLQKFQPVVAIFLARVVLKEQIKSTFLFWAFICLIGAALISYDDFVHISTIMNSSKLSFSQSGSLQGYILVAFSIFGWGAATVFGKKLSSLGYPNEQIMAGRYIMGLCCLIPLVMVNPSSGVFSHGVDVYGKVSLMLLVSGLLAMYLYYRGLRKISARASSLGEMFFPFMAVIVNWLFLGTTLNSLQIVGGAILLGASVVIQLKKY